MNGKRPYRFRFEEMFSKGPSCWEWIGYCKPNGYGQLWNGERIEYAHRFSYRKYVGEIPVALMVCHHCDNRKCVNPDHLFIGTCKDNLQDMAKKGRHVPVSLPGEKNANVKLTKQDVLSIRKRYKPKTVTAMSLANEYGVSEGLIFHIIKRRAWIHV